MSSLDEGEEVFGEVGEPLPDVVGTFGAEVFGVIEGGPASEGDDEGGAVEADLPEFLEEFVGCGEVVGDGAGDQDGARAVFADGAEERVARDVSAEVESLPSGEPHDVGDHA